jgi:crossover junction endodeoxyribonuclease RuvC
MGMAIGIDPGKSGGIAIISDEIYTYPYSDAALISTAKQASTEKRVCVCVEKVNAMPGQGVVSMFNFGKSAGFIEGVLQAFKIPYQLVPPQTWKKEFSLNKEKGKSAEVCRKLFPGVNLYATERCKKEHDGMTEALLMAEYARRKF